MTISRNKRKRQPIGMLGWSSGNHDWLLANASACVSCGFRLGLRNARNASDCIWMETGLYTDSLCLTTAIRRGFELHECHLGSSYDDDADAGDRRSCGFIVVSITCRRTRCSNVHDVRSRRSCAITSSITCAVTTDRGRTSVTSARTAATTSRCWTVTPSRIQTSTSSAVPTASSPPSTVILSRYQAISLSLLYTSVIGTISKFSN